MLDTAANTNTINAAVAQQLNLLQVGDVAGGTGAAGAIGGGATFLLGTCELGDLPKQERFEFLSGLTASALPIASPAAAGLLGVAFLDSFPGGVEFSWGATGKADEGEVGNPPSVTFYGDMQGVEQVTAGLTRIEVLRLPASLLPCVSLRVNGVAMRALLDTGSPITVLNAAAAAASGVSTTPVEGAGGGGGGNPFSRLAASFKSAQAVARGDVLSIMGANGQPTQLIRSLPAAMSVCSATEEGAGGEVAFGSATFYVGDIPGLAALDGLGAAAGPAALLGMDVLRRRYSE